MGFLTVEDGEGCTLHFCSWDCVRCYAAPSVKIVAATSE